MTPSNIVLPDDSERRAIAGELDTTFLVEAAAGTGKTTSLATRMVALLREGKAEAGQIAAITFTRKAAAHLRQKFQNTLEKAHAVEAPGENRDRLALALEQIDRCYIGTIHSFCARLLRERPVEAGVDPGFTELEKADDTDLRDRWWHDYTDRLFAEGSTLPADLERYGIGLDRLQATYNTLCNYPEVQPAVAKKAKPDLSESRKSLREFLALAERALPSQPAPKGWDSMQIQLRRAIRLQMILDIEDDVELVRVLECLDGSGSVTQNRWSDGNTAKEMQARFEEFKSNVVQPMLQSWREYLHPILINAVIPAVDGLANHRRSNAMLNFQDLLMIARDLLRDKPRIRHYFRRRFSHLLVDEFQDTDPIQAELMLYLTGDDSHEMDWCKIRPVPGALFIVGDPKQSIYRFRRADITTYNRVRKIIESSGGRVVQLSTNFRSVESICECVNSTFDSIFPASSTEEQAGQVRLHPRRSSAAPISGVYKLECSSSAIKARYGVRQAYPAYQVQADSEAIAQWIRAALDTGMQIQERDGSTRAATPGDFLILISGKRGTKNLRDYAQALEAVGVPYETTGAGGLPESQEIRTLLPLLKAVVDPDDAVSVLAYLRGPLCGADDRSIYDYKRAGGEFNYASELPAGTDERIARAFAMLRDAREWSRKMPPAAALARICNRLGVVPNAVAQEFGATRAGNLLKMLAFARQHSVDGESFAAIVEHIVGLLDGADIEEMGIEPGRADAVRLMNLHKAKGLEAPVVFLADPTDGKDHSPEYYVDRSTDPPQGHFLITVPHGDHHKKEVGRPLDWDTMATIEDRFQQAEEDRLLYVAATRAMDVLVVSTYLNDTKSPAVVQGPWCQLVNGSTEPLPVLTPFLNSVSSSDLPDLAAEYATVPGSIRSAFEMTREPSYAVTQVTKVTHSDGGLIARAEHGHGASWGRILHGCLEALMTNPSLDVALLVSNLLRQEELSQEDASEIVRLVESVRASDIWQQASEAERRSVEVPFAIKVPSSDLGLMDGPAETVLSGVLDLVYWDGASWVIVDYKSDVTSGRLRQLIEHYRPQVACYRRYWQQITGEPTKAALYFVDEDHLEWLENS